MKKHKIIALLLNLFIGAGYIYIGKPKRAFFILFVPFLILFIGYYLEQYVDFALLLSMLLVAMLYLYSFIDIWRAFPVHYGGALKYSKWYHVLLYVAFSNFVSFFILTHMDTLPTKHFLLSSSSMNNTLFKGDYIVAIKKNVVHRGEIVIFKNPQNPSIYYVKRIVALSGDEILYQDDTLMVHFHEGDAFIEKHYPASAIHTIEKRLWVENPYRLSNPNITYRPEKYSIFQLLAHRENSLSHVFIKEFSDSPVYQSNTGEKYNAFYKKIEENSYFVMGDNRNRSNDSLFFGSVPKRYIYGVLKNVYFNYRTWNRWNIKIK